MYEAVWVVRRPSPRGVEAPTHTGGEKRGLPTVSRRAVASRHERALRVQGGSLEHYHLTPADHRRQEVAVRIASWVRNQVAKAPPLSPESRERIQELLGDSKPGQAQMSWRVRLYCGHVQLITRPRGCSRPDDGIAGEEACGDCGLDPAIIVAYEPVETVSVSRDQLARLQSESRHLSDKCAVRTLDWPELETPIHPKTRAGHDASSSGRAAPSRYTRYSLRSPVLELLDDLLGHASCWPQPGILRVRVRTKKP